ncbi:hypothetical protein F5Y16DRAFT_395050 [Xylariaceae sp. FL0255]|nr:hypothetical protein F5Y16DRAFT_395050 [Xylariaceae sp. FL0255]
MATALSPIAVVLITSFIAVTSTIDTETETILLPQSTETSTCLSGTATVTITKPDITVDSTSVDYTTITKKTITETLHTTTTETAYCHYSSTGTCTGVYCGGFQIGASTGLPVSTAVHYVTMVVMTATVTVTETTYTVTRSSVTVLPASSTTEYGELMFVATVTVTEARSPTTVCVGGRPGATVTVTKPQAVVTVTRLMHSTKTATGTVYIEDISTAVYANPLEAKKCVGDGGYMGWP